MARSDASRPEVKEPLPATPAEEATYQEGFTLKTLLGAIFIALFMLPGGMYLGLVAGQGVGDAAEWVTIVLFAEVARRSYQPLRKQEIYILFYIASSLTAVVNIERGLAGGPFSHLIWNAYYRLSPAARPIADQIPSWAVPAPTSPALMQRELWHSDWWKPILLLVLTEICGRLSWMGMGYALFRITSDVEKLPFPYAPVAASGATALSEAGTESWRWGIFSTGTVIGLLFGLVYIALPVVTGVLIGESVEVFPIPFADYTVNVQNLIPAAIIGLSFSLGNVLLGFVLPYEIVLGSMISSVFSMIVMNPILYRMGMLPNYRPGSDAFVTKLAVDMDFWLSVGIGVNIAIAIIGIALVFKAFGDAKRNRTERKFSLAPPPSGRGDIPIFVAIGAWLGSTAVLVILCRILVPAFPAWILLFFGFFWSPLNSYISARMHGLTGRGVSFPYLKEASVVASGYQRVDVWYAPIPLPDHGAVAQRFREVELTGTKISSIFKAELAMFPIIMLASFGFWAFFWNTSALPNEAFPYAQRFWPVQAQLQSVIQQINVPRADGETGWFAKAIKPLYIAGGTAGGLMLYGVMSIFKAPLLLFYGFAGGLGLYPANTIPQFFGAWYGRKFLARKYGAENWARYAPVLLAGFSCGAGLVSLLSISIALISKAVAKLPY
ncbi:MAG: peptide transporter [Fimbriimonas sp.]